MNEKLLRRLDEQLNDIRNRINWVENSMDSSEFISARLAVTDAESTLREIWKEIKREDTCRQYSA